MAKTKPIISIPAFNIQPGPAPAPTVEIDGTMVLLEWQERGFNELCHAQWRIMTAPTGSGKSTLIKALSAVELADDPKMKVVITVPQRIIGGSFGALKDQCNPVTNLRVKGHHYEWEAGVSLLNVANPVKRLLAFLKAPPGKTPAERVAVCTHATLVAAQKHIAKEKPKRNPWKGVSLYIDEAHHAQCSEAEDEAMSNRLGQLVAYWLDHKLGHITLTTATWLRPNLGAIVPPERMGSFTPFSMKMEEHLALIQVGITFRFIVGKPEDAIRSIFGEADDKTIVYLPNVATCEVKARGKHAVLQSYMDAIGPAKRSDAWTTTLRCKAAKGKAHDIRVVDMVTVEGREERRGHLQRAIDSGACPDVMFALNLGKEGFDWPALVRAVVVGARASIPDVLQMLGRLLRRYPGKRQVEFTIVLPGTEGEHDAEQVRAYLETIVCSMVIDWHCRNEGVDVEKAAKIVRGVAGALVNAGGVLPDAPPTAPANDNEARPTGDRPEKRPLREGARDADDGPLSILPESVRAILSDAGIPIMGEMVRTICGTMQMLVAKFGFADLAALRDALGVNIPYLTAEELWPHVQGLTKEDFDRVRSSIGHCPTASKFPAVYGCTFAEFRDGYEYFGVRVPLEDVAAFARGKTKNTYNATRPAGYPSSSRFMQAYKRTFSEVRDGTRALRGSPANAAKYVSLKSIVSFAQGKTKDQYNVTRPAGFPATKLFRALYGMTYAEARDGRGKRDKAA